VLPGIHTTQPSRTSHQRNGQRPRPRAGAPALPVMMTPAGCPERPAPSRAASRRAARLLAGGPPASLLLVHGAGSGPWVFHRWPRAFPGIKVVSVDLHTGIDVARASHEDYADNAARAARALPQPVSLCGWSMGGLVVLQASQQIRPHSVILLEPSPPAESKASIGPSRSRTAHLIPKTPTGRFRPACDRGRSHRGHGPNASTAYPCRRSRARRWSSTVTNTGSRGECGSPAGTTRLSYTSQE
jgi:pimeloyl-ACP methyl ester carboxylesterase